MTRWSISWKRSWAIMALLAMVIATTGPARALACCCPAELGGLASWPASAMAHEASSQVPAVSSSPSHSCCPAPAPTEVAVSAHKLSAGANGGAQWQGECQCRYGGEPAAAMPEQWSGVWQSVAPAPAVAQYHLEVPALRSCPLLPFAAHRRPPPGTVNSHHLGRAPPTQELS